MAYEAEITEVIKDENLLLVNVVFTEGEKVVVKRQYRLAKNDLNENRLKKLLLEQKLELEAVSTSNIIKTGKVDFTGVTLETAPSEKEIFETELESLEKLNFIVAAGGVTSANVAKKKAELEASLKAKYQDSFLEK